MATAAAIAITFPGGRGWVAKPKMSALISVQLGSYHSAAAACHPPRPLHSIPFIQRHGSIMYTHTRTHTNKHPHFSFCFFTTFLPPSLLFVHTHIQYVLHGNTHLHTHTILPVHLTAFLLLLLLHTLTLCLCQFYLNRSIMQVFHCSFLPHSSKTFFFFQNKVYFS